MVVNAGFDSMGGVTDGGAEISSAPSPQQLSDLEKTQAQLRETFNAAEKYRRELEFLQKGGDPLDLKFGNVAPVSLQSTSLIDPNKEQIVTSVVKGSFAVTASPHDSVESSGRLGAPSVGEANSADNLKLFDGNNKYRDGEKRSLHSRINSTTQSDVALEIPKKSYRRRIRSRPNRDVARSSSTDAGPRSGQPYISSTSKPKSPMSHKNLASNNRLDVKLNGSQNHKSTLSPACGQPLTSDTQEAPLSMCSAEHGSVGQVEQETLGSRHPPTANTQTAGNQDLSRTNDNNSGELQVKKGCDSKSSCSQTNNENEPVAIIRNTHSNGIVEHDLASRESPSMEQIGVNTANDDKISDTGNGNSDPCSPRHNDNGSTLKEEEGLKESEAALQESTLSLRCSTDGPEQHTCPQGNVKLAIKEHGDSVLEAARIIQEKRKRIAGLSVGIFSSDSNHRSHWHFVLQEMSWMANDFAQERLWKVTAASHISRSAAYNSRVRFQQQTSLWKQKEVAHTLAGAVMEFWHTLQVKCHELKLEGSKTDNLIGLHQYGIRFLEYNSSSQAQYNSAQAPMTPDRISDLGIVDILWEDNLTEENLFYTVPSGAIEAYRKSIESHLLQSERIATSVQEEVDAAGFDAVAVIDTQDRLFEEEGETSTYYLPGAYEGGRMSQPAQKKRNHFRSYAPGSYEMVPNTSFMQSNERDIVAQPSVLSTKRPATSINVSIPTKRMRTASRPRFTGPSGYIHVPDRAEASNDDTNSFQDEQSSLHGGPHIANTMEAESVGDYEKQLHFDLTDVSNRPKKKKKAKHPGSMFEHRWQLDSNFQNDQKDHSKRRLDTHQFDSNGNSVTSQTSNMSNPNKFMKLLVRDRGRKAKSLKNPAGQPGSGSPWSLFEDQALVVLVHDMGANWELISDAMNGTLQFKCISRNSKECKERHKILMDRTGDGADSAEDSGSSQPYPSTLPGIPEGSARQLFQRLQGPMEEDTLKSHFEKIIMIWQKQHHGKAQDNQDPKQLQQPHGSHALALSQVCPNNLNGGPVLTPLDLNDAISPSPDFVPVGYQGPHTSGLPVPNHSVAGMVPGSNSASSLPGSSAKALGSHLASASAPLSPSVREGRYGIPRGSLSVDEQHRMQQFNQMSARNMQQTSLPPGSNSGTDRGVRMLPGGAGMGVIGGVNRGMAIARPGYPGISTPMLNPGMTSAIGPGQGNSVRPRETMRMMRPNQNMAPDQLPQQASQGGMGFFANQNSQLHAQPYPHSMSTQQSPHIPHGNSHPHPPQYPAYGGMRFIKERQLHHQRMLQQQFAISNPMVPHVQPQQSPVPVSSPQSSTQAQSQSSSPVSVSPIGTPSMKHPIPPPQRNSQTGGNHTLKQKARQPQQLQPTGRQHPQQAAKVMKGGGRGTIHQNIPAGPSHPNGFSGSQIVAEKGEQQVAHQLVQSGRMVNSKQPMPHSSLSRSQQHMRFPIQTQATSSKQLLSDTSNNHAPSVAPSSSTQPVMTSSNYRQLQQPQKLGSRTQAAAGQMMAHNLKESYFELPISKVHAKEATQISEPFNSPGAMSDKVPSGISRSPPHSNSEGSGDEHDGPAINLEGVHKQSESDSLGNSVKWQEQSSSEPIPPT
uniref:chromatin modification-related protein EAF1 B-like isoform X2 n=1 Tax=Erigeron canadensis TaxID=72917 RepID=UPI001CB94832|nr:chromatin modification-related protein EAF1 B-like isoform X2 [Erigeron canadensis]